MTVDGITYLADVARSRYLHAEHAHSEHRVINDLTFLNPRVCYAMEKANRRTITTWRAQITHNYTECIYCSISIGRSTV